MQYLAPNGQPSNLTPEQWKLVRSPEFKQWFGDWENDPENSSKIVDENGEPLVVYHGSKEKFYVFDLNKVGTKTDTGMWGKGFYFSSDKNYAKTYSEKVYDYKAMKILPIKGNIYDVFLSIKNPLVLVNQKDIPKIIIPNETIEDLENADKIYSEKFRQTLVDKGYDGVFVKFEFNFRGSKSFEIVAFEPNQIKLADGTNTNFDTNNPDIRFKDGGEVIENKIKELEKLPYNKLLLLVNDSYRVLGAEKGLKGYDYNGEPIFGYLQNQTEYMLTSSSSGHKIRFYIEVDKDYVIHPNDIHSSFNVSEQKRLEKNSDYWLKEATNSYKKILTELRKNNEFEIVKESLEKAIKNGFIIESQFGSSDLFKHRPFDILVKEDKIFGGRMARSLSQYIKFQQIDLKTNISDLDLHKFMKEENQNTFNKGGDVKLKLIQKAEKISQNNEYLNCDAFCHRMVDNKLFKDEFEIIEFKIDLKKSFENQYKSLLQVLKAGDIIAFGDKNNVRHYAIYVENDDVLEVEMWGGKPRTFSLKENLYNYENVAYIYRERNNNPISYKEGGITEYPIESKDLWYGDSDYEVRGGKIIMMSPSDYIKSVKPLVIDEISRENIDDLKEHILSGKKLDPLVIYQDGKEDGRHRAYASLELGIKQVPVIVFNEFKEGGRTISQTPAPKKEQISGSDINEENSSSDLELAKLITFDEKIIQAIENKVNEHNAKYPNKKITIVSAKAVVRRGMGAYSSSHRPTISDGKPNSRVAWGLARLNAFIYKIVNGKSESGNYNQDDDLIKELNMKVEAFAEGGEAEAEKVWNSLSDEDKKNLMEAGMKAMDSMKEEYSQKLIDLESQKSALEQKRTDLYEEEKKQENKYDLNLFKERQKIGEQIRDINLQIRHAKNVEKAFFNRGDIVQFEDKKGTLHTNIPSFLKVDTSVIAFDEETILNEEAPVYIPLIDEDTFKSKGFVFDTIRIDKDTYILAVNGYKERERIDKNISSEVASNFYTPQVYEQGFVLVTLDQLVLINDYYITKQKAVYQKEADEKTNRQEGYYDKLPVARREAHLNQKNFYHALPSAVKKKITQAEYEALNLEEKEAVYKPFKRYSAERLKTRLHSNQMWTSFHFMYERFLDPTAVMPKPRNANPIVWYYWKNFREMMSYKMLDIKIQREVDNEQFKKALETSFGDVNTNNVLFDRYGILVKRQDGKQIEPHQIEQIEQGWIKVQKVFGDLVNISKENNIKISHTNDKYVFASKSVGMFVPKMKTIAVSNKYGANTFNDVFAHETAHFIDYVIGAKNGHRYATDDYESTAGILAFKFRELLNRKSESEYINSTKECFARALEQHFAIQTFGDDAQLLFSQSPLAQLTFYFNENNYVSKENYYNEIKPLVEKFLIETGFSAYVESKTEIPIEEVQLVEEVNPEQEIEIKQEKMENAKLTSALNQIDESIKVYLENKNKKTKQLIGESLETAINLLKLDPEYSDNALTDDEKLIVVKKVIEVCKNTLKDSYTSNWMLFDSEINLPFNVWNVLEEMGYIKAENIKSVPFTINPNNEGLKTIFKDILLNDPFRAWMGAIQITNNYATGTDAHKLLHIIGERSGDFEDGVYPMIPKVETKNIAKDVNFPNWTNIFPDSASYRVKVNLKFLYNVMDNLYDNKILGEDLTLVGLRVKEDEQYNFDIVVNYHVFSDLIKSLMRAGFEEMDMCLTTRNRAVMLIPEGAKLDGNPSDRANLINNHSFGLVMPVIISYYDKYPIIDINNKDEYLLVMRYSPLRTITTKDFVKTVTKKEKTSTPVPESKQSEIEFLKSKIEAFQDLIELEDDENEITFLQEKILAFQDILELEELQRESEKETDESKKKAL